MKTFVINTEHRNKDSYTNNKFTALVSKDGNIYDIEILDPTDPFTTLYQTSYLATSEEGVKYHLAKWAKEAFSEDLSSVDVYSQDEVVEIERVPEEIEDTKLKEMLEQIHMAIGKYLGY